MIARGRPACRNRCARAAWLALALGCAGALAPTPARPACIAAREVFAVREAGKSAFRQPSDLALAGDRLLVLDDLNGRVVVLDARGRSAGAVALPDNGDAGWLGIGFGGADQLFLASSGDGRIVVLELNGRAVREFPVDAAGPKARPAGVLVARTTCFVVDPEAHRVRSFSLDGRPGASWGGNGDGPAQFRSPFRIAQDSLDRLLVTDALNSRVLIFTPRGEPLGQIGAFGVTEGTLYRPAALAVLGDDRVVVADAYFGSLQLFDAQGRYQGVLCAADGRPLALESPTGMAAKGRTVYVVEMGAGRVSGWEIGAP